MLPLKVQRQQNTVLIYLTLRVVLESPGALRVHRSPTCSPCTDAMLQTLSCSDPTTLKYFSVAHLDSSFHVLITLTGFCISANMLAT